MNFRKNGKPKNAGFSLIELLAAIIIMAILAGLSGPSMRPFIIKQQLLTASQELIESLQLARSEAIANGGEFRLQPTGTSWSGGWQSEELIENSSPISFKKYKLANELVTIDLTFGNTTDDSIVFDQKGRANTATRFAVSHSVEALNPNFVAYCISVTRSGSIEIAKTNTC